MVEAAFTIQISAATHKGHVRRGNEDVIALGDWLGFGDSASRALEQAVSGRGLLLAVADGLGGHRAGEVASRFLVEQLISRAVPGTVEPEDRFVALLREIDAELRHQMIETPSLRGMGSTLAAAYISTSGITIANVGDSRAYLLDGLGGFRQLSVDHVPRPAPMISSDEAAVPEKRSHEARRTTHAITQALGGSPSRMRALRPHVVRLPAGPGGWSLLLCSDGLTDLVDEHALREALLSAELCADDLVCKALEAGGDDNVSVILARHPAS